MNQINIVNRLMTPDEIDQVNAGFDSLYTDEGIDLESTERISLVATKGDRLLGCASGLAHKNGKAYSGWFKLTDLFTEKEFRNQGIGSALLKELEDNIRRLGIQNIWLWTSGQASLRFYGRHGYVQFTEMETWYSDGSSRVGLRKNIVENDK
ncbi:MAG: GNAT family N-acetyltransferase [Algicola sp.]|nr:GNAT family N-acetyltransferase [Algicola sp.]